MTRQNTDEVKKRISKRINKLCRSEKLSDKEVVLTPAGLWAPYIIELLRNNGITSIKVTDNGKQKIGVECSGILVCATEEYLSIYKKDRVVIICANAKIAFLIGAQLDSLNYTENHDYYFIWQGKRKAKRVVTTGYIKKFDGIITFLRACFNIFRSYVCYYNILRRNNITATEKVFINPGPASGDVYISCVYLNGYILNKNIKKYSYFVSSNLAVKTAKLFALQKIVEINDQVRGKLLYLFQNFGEEKTGLRPAFPGWYRTRSAVSLVSLEKDIAFTQADQVKFDVFKLDPNIQPRHPIFNNSEDIPIFFLKNSLIKNQTVIIAPYAGTFDTSIPIEFWSELAAALIFKGYIVCTNSANEKEIAIPGTKAVYFPLSMSVPVLEHAGFFVGIRSGLCDVVSSSKCKMAIIYDTASRINRFDIFSLRRMGFRDDVLEIAYNSKNYKSIIESIINYYEYCNETQSFSEDIANVII